MFRKLGMFDRSLGMFQPPTKIVYGAVSPAQLFAAGEQGVWYDPSDWTTLFQDAAGTTPVTAIEQPVGLMLDKSKGLVASTKRAFHPGIFGSNFSTPHASANNITGDIDVRWSGTINSFASDMILVSKWDGVNNPWFFYSGSDSKLHFVVNTGGNNYPTSIVHGLTAGVFTWVRVTRASATGAINFYKSTDGSSWTQIGTQVSGVSGNINNVSAPIRVGDYNVTGAALSGTTNRAQIYNGINGTLAVDFNPLLYTSGSTFTAATGEVWTINGNCNITPDGNHATQSTTTSRPILRNRYNLLTYTEQFDNAVWGNLTAATNIVSNATTAPDGTNTADFFRVASTTNTDHLLQQIALSAIGSGTFTLTLRLKPNGITRFRIAATSTAQPALTNRAWVNTDLSNLTQISGIDGTGFTVVSTSVTPADAYGFHTVSLTYTTTATSIRPYIVMQDESGNFVFAGTIDTGLYIWGASLVVANESSLPYQWVTTGAQSTSNPVSTVTAGYDTDVTKFPPYLFFDGSDDWLSTANINFSATDKMSVFAGVRKLSDSQQGIIAELSATIASNNGAFMLSAPNSAAANYNFSSKGTSQVDNTVTTYAAPITNVVTGLADISGPNNTIRINGAATPLTTSQGTGNYGNYPLYIGARFGTTTRSLFFFGRVYSLIVRGTPTSSPQLEQTERWVAGKTGVTL